MRRHLKSRKILKNPDPEEPEKPDPKPEEPDPKPEEPETKPEEQKPHRPSSGGGSSSSTGRRPAVVGNTRGEMTQQADGNKHFLKAQTGTYAQNEWAKVDGKWYYFNDKTNAVKGWNLIDGHWYFLNEADNTMQTGWHADSTDGNWYLLNANGTLATGWVQIAGKFYFLNNTSAGATYTQNADGSWTFNGNKNLPYGAMYKDGLTPDGYRVGPDGAWDGLPRQSR